MDKYLVDPLSRWIIHSTGWTEKRSKFAARLAIVIVVLVVAVFVTYPIYLDR